MIKIVSKGVKITSAPKGVQIITGVVRATASAFVDLYAAASTDGQTDFSIAAMNSAGVESVAKIISLSAYGTPQSQERGDFTLSSDGATIVFTAGVSAGTEIIATGAK